MRCSSVLTGVVSALALTSVAANVDNKPSPALSTYAQDYFDDSMAIADARFDSSYGYVWYLDKGEWSVRFTAWYIPGLLYRNQGDDLANAEKALRNIISNQMNYNDSVPWYGDYKLSPDQPNPTTGDDVLYPESIYNTYDPNWHEFIGSSVVQALAEFEHLLDPQLVKDLETSLSYAAIGHMRRNGTLPDNLILGYGNPQLMGMLLVGWIGERLNNASFIDFANTRGEELYELFTANGSNTLTEYNVPTYYGEDIFALSGCMKYLSSNLTFPARAKYMLTEIWKDIADHYNPYLGNLAGPYDRAYARDMPTHCAITGQFWWGMFGYDVAPVPWKGNDDFRYDLAQGPSLALLMSTVLGTISKETQHKLLVPFTEERFLHKTIREDLSTDVLRYADSWLSKELMIGGETLAEDVNRGSQFVPAIVHWASDPNHTPFPYGGWFELYPTASTITTVVGARTLSISYPNATQTGSNLFTYLISGIPPVWNLQGNTVNGFSNLPCLSVNVSAPGLEIQPTTYYNQIISNQYYYNVSYVVPANYSGVPTMSFELEYTCEKDMELWLGSESNTLDNLNQKEYKILKYYCLYIVCRLFIESHPHSLSEVRCAGCAR